MDAKGATAGVRKVAGAISGSLGRVYACIPARAVCVCRPLARWPGSRSTVWDRPHVSRVHGAQCGIGLTLAGFTEHSVR